jgi:hypothetical protein
MVRPAARLRAWVSIGSLFRHIENIEHIEIAGIPFSKAIETSKND